MARLPGLIDASKPWLAQALPLLSGKEGGGAAKFLRKAVPGLAGAAQAGKAIALPQLNRISLCTTQVLVPTFDQTIEDQFSTGGPAYREFMYWLSALVGQTQNFDGNGRYLRIQPSTGDLLLRLPNPEATESIEQEVFGHSSVAPSGLQPQLGGRPPKKPEVRCDRNPVPELNGPPGQPGNPAMSVVTP